MAALLMGLGRESHGAAVKLGAVKGPEVRSAMALVVDANSGEVIFERNGTSVVPIASITKLMTALVIVDGKQPLDEIVELTAADRWKGKGAHSRIPIGSAITRANLLRLALMASENRAAQTLSRAYPGGKRAFVKAMNAKAKLLGMTQSRFADASGLSSQNVSSARDLSKLINAASQSATIREYSTLPSVEVRISKRSTLAYRNTNLLIGKPDWEILIQKTGYTNDAGECLVMQAVLDEREVNIVLLNSFGKLTRTADARRIRRWMDAQKAPVATTASGRAAE
ncbi:MAG: D-alanyl-D-alanine endopeptidase [Steroidobacteraceae bacterium]|nr:D-alanyl-D-alanine endopeptidase [Steroidobacteraceae bacterium]